MAAFPSLALVGAVPRGLPSDFLPMVQSLQHFSESPAPQDSRRDLH